MVFRQALQKVTEVDLEPLKTSEVVFFIGLPIFLAPVPYFFNLPYFFNPQNLFF